MIFTVFTVKTPVKGGESQTRLTTINKDEAEAYANAIYNHEHVLPEMFEHEVEQKIHQCKTK